MEAHRPAGKLLNLAADPEEDLDEQEMTEEVSNSEGENSFAENSSKSARQVTFWPQNGWMGLDVASTGSILAVYKHRGSQAERLGLQTGQYITKVGGQRFTLASLEQARKELYEQSVPFNITVQTQSEGEVAFRSVLSCMALPAGIVGCLLVLCLPWITYKTLASGSQVPCKSFGYPLVLAV
eukprot:Skav224390  [mRNA]  locus=scaffold2452:23492:24037:- [translate_table: standard]